MLGSEMGSKEILSWSLQTSCHRLLILVVIPNRQSSILESRVVRMTSMQAVVPSVVETGRGGRVVSVDMSVDTTLAAAILPLHSHLCSNVRGNSVGVSRSSILSGRGRITDRGIVDPIHGTSSRQARPRSHRVTATHSEMSRGHGRRPNIRGRAELMVGSICWAPSRRDSRAKRVTHTEEMSRSHGVGGTDRSAGVGNSTKRDRALNHSPVLAKEWIGHHEWIEEGRASGHTCTETEPIPKRRRAMLRRPGTTLSPELLKSRHGALDWRSIAKMIVVKNLRSLQSLGLLLSILKVLQIAEILCLMLR